VPQLDWADLAAEQRWEEAIVAYLEANGKTPLWRVVNSVVAESRPTTRSTGRAATKEALADMMLLIRQRRVKRHRRRWVCRDLLFAPELRTECWLPASGRGQIQNA
jgi:hypothetical protein